jgi:hypothetical protein
MSDLRDLPHSICHRDLMLATPGKLFSAPGWIYEIKYDGFRCLVSKLGGVVRWSRGSAAPLRVIAQMPCHAAQSRRQQAADKGERRWLSQIET